MSVNITIKQKEYLKRIDEAKFDLDQAEERYKAERKQKRMRLADIIEEARIESDMSYSYVAKHLDKTRQAINNLMIERFGIRNPEKSKAASLGHEKRINA